MRSQKNRYRPNREKQKARVMYRFRQVLWLNLVGIGVLALSAAFAHGYHALLELPWLQLEAIEIKGLQRLDRANVLKTLAIPKTSNLFSIRTALLAKRLEALPWVQSAIVRLDPPRRLVVEIAERQPFAVVYTTTFLLMDVSGKLFLEVKPESYKNLPLVTGLMGANFKLGDSISAESFRVLSSLLLSLDKYKASIPLDSVSEFRWQETDGFTLYTTRGGMPVHLGYDHFEQKLTRLLSIMKFFTERQWWGAVQAIDMDFPRQAYVKGHFNAHKGI